jgi:hypothetical protein
MTRGNIENPPPPRLTPSGKPLPPSKIVGANRAAMGSMEFAAQYQQAPVPIGGNLIKWSWFKLYDTPPTPRPGDKLMDHSGHPDVCTRRQTAPWIAPCLTIPTEEVAQFERELIGERVRDKIAASKRKGIWVGGPVPLGYAAVDKRLVVVAAEAEAVCTILTRYLALGSVRTLADDLDRLGIRSKPRQLSNGRTIGGGSFGVGALAYLLKNRFYVGEVVYRGDNHRGDHAPILDRALFEAVQAKLAAQAVARRCRLRGSPALLTGRLFDQRGNRMSPSHTNKGGARYRYYVSQAVLQNKPQAAGSIGRVPAAEIEALVMTALRNHLQVNGTDAQSLPDNERKLIERHVERVILTPSTLNCNYAKATTPRTRLARPTIHATTHQGISAPPSRRSPSRGRARPP